MKLPSRRDSIRMALETLESRLRRSSEARESVDRFYRGAPEEVLVKLRESRAAQDAVLYQHAMNLRALLEEVEEVALG